MAFPTLAALWLAPAGTKITSPALTHLASGRRSGLRASLPADGDGVARRSGWFKSTERKGGGYGPEHRLLEPTARLVEAAGQLEARRLGRIQRSKADASSLLVTCRRQRAAWQTGSFFSGVWLENSRAIQRLAPIFFRSAMKRGSERMGSKMASRPIHAIICESAARARSR